MKILIRFAQVEEAGYLDMLLPLAQPFATMVTACAVVWAAKIAFRGGDKTRENETERSLRDRFFKITENLSENNNYVKREAGVYALVALADDWATFHRKNPASAQLEQQTCLNVITGQLRDAISTDLAYAGESSIQKEDLDREQLYQKSALLTFKHRIQEIITERFIPHNQEKSGTWSHLDLDLSSCHFHDVQFNRAIFRGQVRFDKAHFHARASFDEAHFHARASFDEAHFKGNTTLDAATFSKETSFDGTSFQGSNSFKEAHFHANSPLNGAKFYEEADLESAHFYASSPLDGAKYCEGIKLQAAHFYANSSFSETDFSKEVIFDGAVFHGDAVFKEAVFKEDSSFDGAVFHGDAVFKEAVFKEGTSFNETLFHQNAFFSPVDFDGIASFLGTHFHKSACFTDARLSEDIDFAGALFCADLHLWELTYGDSRPLFEATRFQKREKTEFANEILEDELLEAKFGVSCPLEAEDEKVKVKYLPKRLGTDFYNHTLIKSLRYLRGRTNDTSLDT